VVIDDLEAEQAAVTLGSVVIVQIGTNGTFTASEFDARIQILAGVPRVVVVHVKVPRPRQATTSVSLG
jgi:hypothetical protein